MVKLDIPTRLYIGDTITLAAFDLGDYPAASWSLSIYLANETSKQEITVTEVAGEYVIAQDSTGWAAGSYNWVAFATLTAGGARQEIANGEILLLADIAAVATTALDFRTTNELTLARIESVMAGKANTDDLQTVVDGDQLQRYTWDELIQAKRHYQQAVNAERLARDHAAGKTGAGKLRFSF